MAEGGDPAWSVNTAQQAADTIATEEWAGTSLVDVQCGNDLCRVHLSHADEESQLNVAGELSLTPPFNTSGIIEFIEEAGRTETIVYMAREGMTLPDREG
jgi:hypothetical protein